MKKVFALVVALAAITMSAQAQIDFGVKGGLNLSKMSASKDALNSSNQLGFFVGPTAKFTLPVVGLGIDVSALFDQRSSEVELNGMKETIKQTSLQIPANVRFAFGFGDKASIFIFGGPQIGFNLSGKAKDVFNDAAELHDAMYEILEGQGLKPQKGFQAIYKMILGQKQGPRAASFLLSLDNDFVVKRLRKEA